MKLYRSDIRYIIKALKNESVDWDDPFAELAARFDKLLSDTDCGEKMLDGETNPNFIIIEERKNNMDVFNVDAILRIHEENEIKIKVVLDDGAYMPERAHKTDAGLDIRSPISKIILAHDSTVIDSGVHIEIPKGFVGMIKSKSGLNVKYGITSEGVIDAGYTGTIRVKLYNNSSEMYRIERGDKITQLVILPIITPDIEVVESLEDTERGNNGFGSTGK